MKKRNILLIVALLTLGAGSLFGIETLDGNLDSLVKKGVGSSQVAGGGFFYMAAAYVPFTVIILALLYGIGSAMKERQPNDSGLKLVTSSIVGGFYGYVGALIIWVIIGLVVNQDMTSGFKMTSHYWSSSVKEVAGGDVFSGSN